MAKFTDRMLRHLDAAAATEPSESSLVRRDLPERVPLSAAQERLWFMHQLDPASYVVQVALRIRGNVRAELWERAMEAVVARHEILRTTFHASEDGRAFQVIRDQVTGRMTRRPCEPGETLEEAAARVASAERAVGVSLVDGPLIRCVLIERTPSEHAAVFTLHHIVSDGWSVAIFLRDFGEFYRAGVEGRPARLPVLSVRFADYAVWERERLHGDELSKLASYWKRQLAGAPRALRLPMDRPRAAPGLQARRGAERATLPIAREVDARLVGLGRSVGATPFITYLAVCALLLARTARQDEVVIGTQVALRDRTELEGLVGLFLNGLALRIPTPATATFLELLEHAKSVALEAYEHGGYPFERLVAHLEPERDASRHPIFQVHFAIDNFPKATDSLGELTLEGIELETAPPELDLSFRLSVDGASPSIAVEYDAALFEAATVRRLLARFVRLAEIVGAVHREGSTLDGLLEEASTKDERDALWAAQRREREEARSERALSFWREELAGAPLVLELPTDKPRSARTTSAGSSVTGGAPSDVVRGLRAIGEREGATLSMVLLAAYAVVLSKQTGQRDVVVGTPETGRPNAMPLRVKWERDAAFGDVVREVRSRSSRALNHQDVPLAQLLEALSPERDASRSPVYQTMFVLESEPASHAGEFTTELELTLACAEAQDGSLHLSLRYKTDLFEPATATRMLAHYLRVLTDVAEGGAEAGELGGLTEAEQGAVLASWNATAHALDATHTVYGLFVTQAEREPGRPAVVCGETSWSYGELRGRAEAYAATYARAPAGPVAVQLRRSLELVAALLGASAAGRAYVPLDPALPEGRRSYVLARSGARVLVAEDDETATVFDGTVVRPAEVGVAATEARWLRRHHPEAVAYVMFTSGSTGKPKGVAVTQRGFVNLLRAMEEVLGASAADRWLAITTVSFDISQLELFLPLIVGGTTVLGTEEEVKDAALLMRRLREGEITVFQATPSLYGVLFDAGWGGARIQLLCGGEAISESLGSRLSSVTGRAWNVYGPTETTIWSSALPLEGGAVRLGGPLWNTSLYVLDETLNEVGEGLCGELYIGGVGLAQGYVGEAGLTADRFVPDRHGAPGARMYRTGDRVRRLAGGELSFLGRVDHQVKLRGFRIELGEIENALQSVPGVRNAAVVLREDVPGQKYLAGYVVLEAGASLAEDRLRASLSSKLPGYMVPSTLAMLDELPLNTSGKVDRKALPRPALSGVASHVEPRTEAERAVAEIFGAVLGQERVSATGDFFALGGHSLLAMQLVSRLRQRFEVEVGLREVFDTATVEGLAGSLSGRARRSYAGIARASREGPRVLSYAQERLYFLEQLTPGMTAYNIPSVLRVRGRLDVPSFDAAVRYVMSRHESLRTRFAVREGRAVQEVTEPPASVVELVDAERWSDGDVERAVEAELGRGFDLANGPLVRVRVVRRGAEEHVVVFTVHHIVTDGWSMGVLVREVGEAYAAYARGEEPSHAALAIQYADYAAWQRAELSGARMESELSFWKGELSGAPPVLELPTDKPRPAMVTYAGLRVPGVVPSDVVRALRAVGEREGATLFMVLLAAYAVVLSKHTGQRDVVVGTPVAGRVHPDTEGLIGMFVNSLPLRVKWGQDATFADVVREVKSRSVRAMEHQDVPLAQLVEAVSPERDTSRSPLFQTMFVLQNTPPGSSDFGGGLVFEPHGGEPRTAQFELTLSCAEDADGSLQLSLEYNTDLFEHATAELVLGRYGRWLETLSRNPIGAVGALAPVWGSDAERSSVSSLSRGESRALTWASLPELLAERAAAEPLALAVRDGARTFTYAAWESRTNQLAHRLSELGVGRESIVGVMLERSAELVASVWGVLKAGGAYLPLDPELPEQRLVEMMEDAGVAVVIVGRGRGGAFGGRPVVEVEVDLDARWPEPETALDARLAGSQLAYVIYTSGSTGRAKGVMSTHEGLRNRLEWMGSAYPLERGDVILQKTPYSFDVSVWELFWALGAGETLEIAKAGGHRDARYLIETIASRGVTVCHFVPSMLTAFLEELAPGECGGLRRVFASGEALTREQLGDFAAKLPHAELVNLYGPTEASIDVTYWEARSLLQESGARVPIGRPVWNTRTMVVAGDHREVGLGMTGELCLGGIQLARGYVGRPALTAERFVPDPNSDVPGARTYRTGDLARWNHAGQLEYLGRIDHQVKLRGFRIELGEIESTLQSAAGVSTAVVVLREDVPGQKYLAGYVVAEPGALLAEEQLRALLSSKLPAYMVPSTLTVLEKVPLNASGKVDRKALPRPDRAVSDGSMPQPLEGEAEEALGRVWKEVLGVERLGRGSNFFALGGDSILSLRVVALSRQAGWEVKTRDLFESKTLRELASIARRVTSEGTALEQGEVEGAVTLLPIQRELLEERGAPHHFNQAVLLRVARGSEMTLEHLSDAMKALVEQHDMLRAAHARRDGVWHQEVLAVSGRPAAHVEEVDLRELSGEALSARLEAECHRVQTTMTLGGPLVRVGLFRLGDGSARVLIAIHHLVVDGVSWRILLEDLERWLGEVSRGERPRLLPKTTSYRRWTDLVSGSAATFESRELEYWRSRKWGETRRLPWGVKASEIGASALYEASLTELETDGLLRDALGSYRLEVNDVLLAALGATLRELTSATTVAIELEGHGREEDAVPGTSGVDLSRTVGWFTTVYPVVLELGHATAGALLKLAKESLRNVPSRGLGYGIVKTYGTPEARAALGEQRRCEVLFNYLGQFDRTFRGGPESRLAFAEEGAGSAVSAAHVQTHVLEVNALVAGGALNVSWRLPEAVPSEEARRWLSRYMWHLRALIEHGRTVDHRGATPSDFRLVKLTQAEVDGLVARGRSRGEVERWDPLESTCRHASLSIL